MNTINREILAAYVEDALGDAETAHVEQQLRQSERLRQELRALMQEQDQGEHSVGAIWRRNRLTCPTREQLGSYLLDVLEPGIKDYLSFHLRTLGCAFCLANLVDLQSQQQEAAPAIQQRRRRYFASSAGLLRQEKKS